MFRTSLGLGENLREYLLSVSVKETAILQELREETAKYPMAIMQISPEQGQFMGLLVKLIGAKKALEIGVFTGYSTLVVAAALPTDGKVIACDNNEEYTSIASKYWEKSGYSEKIDLRISPAIETLDKLIEEGQSGSFDFAFIDADKSNYDGYYERSLELVRQGGLITIDNVLWSGRVADPEVQDNRTKKIRNLNQKLYEDERIDLCMLPIADGLTLAMKK